MKKILYVEDNRDTAEAVKIMLSGAGYSVELAHNGKDALAKAESGFELFLLDVMLPDMSGWDIFEKLKAKRISAKYAFLSAIPVSSERMRYSGNFFFIFFNIIFSLPVSTSVIKFILPLYVMLFMRPNFLS